MGRDICESISLKVAENYLLNNRFIIHEGYSKLMLSEGATTPVDEDLKFEMKLPEWVDAKKVKMGQRFIFLNMNAMFRASFFGLMTVLPVESLTQVLIFTKQSSTPALSYKRFRANTLHAEIWYKNSIEPGTIAWQSIETIRRMHVVINKRSTKAGVGIISQKDMAITLFLFMGFQLLMPDKFGIVGSYEQFDAFNHFWRLIGYLLGIEDRFNCCGEFLGDTQSRLQSIKKDMLLPEWKDPFPECLPYSRITFDGLWHSDPTLHYDSLIFMIKRAVGLPGYHYFDSESTDFKEENKKIMDSLSVYTRLRIFLDVIIFEYLSHIFIFRWIFNIFRVFLVLFELYPILAIISFGKKYAFVEIMKSKKSN